MSNWLNFDVIQGVVLEKIWLDECLNVGTRKLRSSSRVLMKWGMTLFMLVCIILGASTQAALNVSVADLTFPYLTHLLAALCVHKVVLYILLVMHWVACGWHLLADLEDAELSWYDTCSHIG